MTKKTVPDAAWANQWLGAVTSGVNTMSHRKVSSIEKRGGGLKYVAKLAKQRGVHLVRLTDDRGNELIAASKRPFEVIC
jgi:hypothetical protein